MFFCALILISALPQPSLVPPAAQFVTSSLPNVFAPAAPSCTAQKLSSVYPHSRRLSKRNDFPQEVVCPVATVQVLTAPLQHPTLF